MVYNVKTISSFEKQTKRLFKKYASLKKELLELVKNIRIDPEIGTPIGKNCYKIRIAIASKGKGKSGGARIITNFVISDSTVYLLSIYDKSEKDNISDRELIELLSEISE
ncbi:hypothetical protein EZ449_17220 [Pedobacter frigidisoli]|uniref:mRNA-degrading endonuclease RelE, toxin component of the RelBE toxin-antitoxin system n=1 Tax=Pedobacter frigidisoli TaxID=2530455 RepID=A0A4R0NT35_9SPHI|nr:type II toxin-antitoxin system RelE/ParE family toxin [Pedobacter frigidisoli]TCD04380.1 hypothetical protein EZ449_17220 [Pedobacter frigidisoli]